MPKTALKNKMEAHNKKSKHKVTMRMLEAVYDRGVGAYRTNPSSVRPNVTGPEQWAMARVNSFLKIVTGAKKANHDKDLLPSGHPSSSKKSVTKAKLANDVFSTEMEARARSMDMGCEGKIHVHEDGMGQAVYMPCGSHEEYLAYYSRDEVAEDPEEPSVNRLDALRAIVQEVMKEEFTKAEYQGEKVTLNKPRRIQGGNKKFEVFVQDGGKVKRVAFGDPNMEIRRDDPKARANFRSRHSCDTKKDKTTAGYWSCRMWEGGTSVSELTKAEEDFKPHQMYDPKTGDALMAATYEQHLDLKERGYTHNKPLTKSIEGQILKADEEQRLVYGWASVVTEKGEPVVDRQGDVIEPDTLVKAVNGFMEHIRVGKQMHTGDQIGAVIHSMPITKEIGESLGIQSDREGWIVAFKVYDDNVWAKVKSGELAAFSIGGRAIKEDYSA